MRVRWTLTLAASIALVLGVAGPVTATDPVTLGADYVLDQVEALSPDEEAKVQERLEKLSADTGVDLYVVFVTEFSNPTDSAAWATATYSQNGLGTKQLLLAVAVGSRQYYIASDPEAPVSYDQVADVESALKPYLSDEDFAGAVIAAADAVAIFIASPGSWITIGLVVVAGITAIAMVIVYVRRRRRLVGKAAPVQPAISLEQLEKQAASALIATDNAIKTSEQELGFARAQFGDDAAAEFTEVLAAARTTMNEAFLIQQELDDEVPDTDEQIRTGYTQIIELCEQASDALDAKADAFDALRELAQNAPGALERARNTQTKTQDAVHGAADRLNTLRAQYSERTVRAIADNPEQAEQRLVFAQAQLTEAQQAIGAGDGDAAAINIRAAENALAQAADLSSAIDTLGADLAASESGSAAAIAGLQQDIATAKALPDPDGKVAAIIAATQSQIATATEQLSGVGRDPVTIEQNLTAADAQIDAVVQSVRDAQQRAERQSALLAQTLSRAQSRIATAESYISTRRGAVGATARTRVSEASAAVLRAQSLQATDPEQALAQAHYAAQLSAQALQSAQQDVGEFAPQGGSGGSHLSGAIIGGIIGGILSGGSGGSFGGATFGGGSSRVRSSGSSFGGVSLGGLSRGLGSRRGGGRF